VWPLDGSPATPAATGRLRHRRIPRHPSRPCRLERLSCGQRSSRSRCGSAAPRRYVSPESAKSAISARFRRPSNFGGHACSRRRMSSSSGTRGRLRGTRMVMPRTGLSASRPTSTHHRKKVFSGRKQWCTLTGFTVSPRRVRYCWMPRVVKSRGSRTPRTLAHRRSTPAYPSTVRGEQLLTRRLRRKDSRAASKLVDE
jgi:hypothetical protein